jgi:hypothetical protein
MLLNMYCTVFLKFLLRGGFLIRSSALVILDLIRIRSGKHIDEDFLPFLMKYFCIIYDAPILLFNVLLRNPSTEDVLVSPRITMSFFL